MSTASQLEVERLLGRGLAEQVPFNIAVIDRDFRIVAANRNFEDFFGEWQGWHCYQVYKRAGSRCARCLAEKTFEDGRVRVSDETGVDRHGRTCHYVVHVAPLIRADGSFDHVLKMTTDLTETRRWQREYDLFFERVPCYVSVIDRDFRIVRANEKFQQRFGDAQGRRCFEMWKRQTAPCANCPASLTFRDGNEHTSSQAGVYQDGTEAHYVVTTAPLARGEPGIAHVIEMATDITEVRKLERELLEAERLSAVGQTVAGLAHTIKNLLMGLEGGMYMLDTGLRRSDPQRIARGWGLLQRNFEKTTALVKDFLSFAKGRVPELRPVDPNALVRGLVELYREPAMAQGVELVLETASEVAVAPLDPEGIETCLTNLLSNGVDAATMRETGGGRVVLRTREDGGDLVFEVEDNGCGIDREVRQKIFTTFFTTKGGKGTGLGLLTTRRIVQEHGGRMELESEAGAGSTFRIRLPRDRLIVLAAAGKRGDDGDAQAHSGGG
jgi:PAS domain S-box-containing protein